MTEKKSTTAKSSKSKSSTPPAEPPAEKPSESPEAGTTAKAADVDDQGRPPTHDNYGETHDDGDKV